MNKNTVVIIRKRIGMDHKGDLLLLLRVNHCCWEYAVTVPNIEIGNIKNKPNMACNGRYLGVGGKPWYMDCLIAVIKIIDGNSNMRYNHQLNELVVMR